MGNSYSNNKNEEKLRSNNTVSNNYSRSLLLEKQKYDEFRTKTEIMSNSSCGCFSYLFLNHSTRNRIVSH